MTPSSPTPGKQRRGEAVRDHLVDTAARLFYERGVHAVGVDEVVRESGMAKASLYRWFDSKDDLVLAVLQLRDERFWREWDQAAAAHQADPAAELHAQLAWMQALATLPGYRGCPFVNTSAEFDGDNADIRARCLAHEQELARRLTDLVGRMDVADPDELVEQLHVCIVGTFATAGLFPDGGPARRLRAMGNALVAAALAS